jgi:hypothetical protein
MLQKVRRLLGFQVTIGQLIAVGLIVGTPYLLVGTIWSTTHTEHLHEMHGVDLAVSFLGSPVESTVNIHGEAVSRRQIYIGIAGLVLAVIGLAATASAPTSARLPRPTATTS